MAGITEAAESGEEQPEPQLSTPVEQPTPEELPETEEEEQPVEEPEEGESYLPSPEELGVDLTQNK